MISARAVAVKFSDMGTKCWSALRFINDCRRCKKVMTCNYPRAPLARTKVATQLIEYRLEKVAKEMAG